MCTRAFNNHEGVVFTTGRNMDWSQVFETSLYRFPAGTEKTGLQPGDADDLEPLTWTAEYDSMVAVVKDLASSDGINSEGLVANVLYQSDCQYESEGDRSGKKGLSVLAWVQYVLDNFKTVAQVVEEFEKNEIAIIPAMVPQEGPDQPADLHLSISDREGGSAIIEMNYGKLDISYSPEYRIMTNDPKFKLQREMNTYWRYQWDSKLNKHPSETLPGTPFSPDRFARAYYYLNNLRTAQNEAEAVAQMFGVLNNACVPFGYQPEGIDLEEEPNIADTIWSVVAAHNSLNYYFSDSQTPNTFWTRLDGEFPATPADNNCLTLPVKTRDAYYWYNGLANQSFVGGQDPWAVKA